MMVPDIPPRIKFEIIQETLKKEDNKLTIAQMCKIANVSRSGYYNWVASEKNRVRSMVNSCSNCKI